MIRLGVNLDHIATVRQARGEAYPDPVQAAILAEIGGADNITCHLREDRRHIQDRDLRLLKETIKIPLNFEMAATEEMLAIAKEIRPEAVTLVPEKRQELTTEGGLDITQFTEYLKPFVHDLKEMGTVTCLFVEPDIKVMEACAVLEADAVEIHTGDFCREVDAARKYKDKLRTLVPLLESSRRAHELGMQVHFGHGLHYQNAAWIQHVPEAEEANIGHSIIARAIYVGLEKATREMKDLLNNPIHKP